MLYTVSLTLVLAQTINIYPPLILTAKTVKKVKKYIFIHTKKYVYIKCLILVNQK